MSSGAEKTRNGLLLGVLAALVLLAHAKPARAHDFDPGVLAIREDPTPAATPSSSYRFRFTPPVDTRGPDVAVTIRFPAGCQIEGPVLRCDAAGFSAPLSFVGLTGKGSRIIVVLTRRDGSTSERIVTSDEPVVLDAVGQKSEPKSPRNWLKLGASHLLGGPDHLAFLLGLLALVPKLRSLLLAVTAFSCGHALSLGLTASGFTPLPARVAEALIALSVLLVAREALSEEDSFTRRAPFFASLAFGLVHGLGFAAALGDKGFPQEGLATALLLFHLGIEAAQLAIIALALGSVRLLAHFSQLPTAARPTLLYALGCLGAFWSFGRIAAIVTGG